MSAPLIGRHSRFVTAWITLLSAVTRVRDPVHASIGQTVWRALLLGALKLQQTYSASSRPRPRQDVPLKPSEYSVRS